MRRPAGWPTTSRPSGTTTRTWRPSRGRTSGPPTCSPSWRRRACRASRRPTPGRWRSASACSCGRSRRRTGGPPVRRRPRPRRRPRRVGRGGGLARPGGRGRPPARDLRPALEERLACGAGLLAARQVDGGPVEEAGAWFRDDVTRMDDQQHSLSGTARGRGPDRAGSMSALVAFLVAVNPPVIAAALPRSVAMRPSPSPRRSSPRARGRGRRAQPARPRSPRRERADLPRVAAGVVLAVAGLRWVIVGAKPTDDEEPER